MPTHKQYDTSGGGVTDDNVLVDFSLNGNIITATRENGETKEITVPTADGEPLSLSDDALVTLLEGLSTAQKLRTQSALDYFLESQVNTKIAVEASNRQSANETQDNVIAINTAKTNTHADGITIVGRVITIERTGDLDDITADLPDSVLSAAFDSATGILTLTHVGGQTSSVPIPASTSTGEGGGLTTAQIQVLIDNSVSVETSNRVAVDTAITGLLDVNTDEIATIKTAVALNTEKETYPAEDKAKLVTIETDAKDDQTGAEIVSILESLVEETRLDGSAIKNLPLGGATSNADIDARVAAGVEDWAETGNAAFIPGAKIANNEVTTNKIRTQAVDSTKLKRGMIKELPAIVSLANDDSVLLDNADGTIDQNFKATIQQIKDFILTPGGLVDVIDTFTDAEVLSVQTQLEILSDPANKITLDKFGISADGNPTFNGNDIDTTIAQRDVYNDIDSDDNTVSLAAAQGKRLKGFIDILTALVALNTAKRAYPLADQTKLATISENANVNVAIQGLTSSISYAINNSTNIAVAESFATGLKLPEWNIHLPNGGWTGVAFWDNYQIFLNDSINRTYWVNATTLEHVPARDFSVGVGAWTDLIVIENLLHFLHGGVGSHVYDLESVPAARKAAFDINLATLSPRPAGTYDWGYVRDGVLFFGTSAGALIGFNAESERRTSFDTDINGTGPAQVWGGGFSANGLTYYLETTENQLHAYYDATEQESLTHLIALGEGLFTGASAGQLFARENGLINLPLAVPLDTDKFPFQKQVAATNGAFEVTFATGAYLVVARSGYGKALSATVNGATLGIYGDAGSLSQPIPHLFALYLDNNNLVTIALTREFIGSATGQIALQYSVFDSGSTMSGDEDVFNLVLNRNTTNFTDLVDHYVFVEPVPSALTSATQRAALGAGRTITAVTVILSDGRSISPATPAQEDTKAILLSELKTIFLGGTAETATQTLAKLKTLIGYNEYTNIEKQKLDNFKGTVLPEDLQAIANNSSVRRVGTATSNIVLEEITTGGVTSNLFVRKRDAHYGTTTVSAKGAITDDSDILYGLETFDGQEAVLAVSERLFVGTGLLGAGLTVGTKGYNLSGESYSAWFRVFGVHMWLYQVTRLTTKSLGGQIIIKKRDGDFVQWGAFTKVIMDEDVEATAIYTPVVPTHATSRLNITHMDAFLPNTPGALSAASRGYRQTFAGLDGAGKGQLVVDTAQDKFGIRFSDSGGIAAGLGATVYAKLQNDYFRGELRTVAVTTVRQKEEHLFGVIPSYAWLTFSQFRDADADADPPVTALSEADGVWPVGLDHRTGSEGIEFYFDGTEISYFIGTDGLRLSATKTIRNATATLLETVSGWRVRFHAFK